MIDNSSRTTVPKEIVLLDVFYLFLFIGIAIAYMHWGWLKQQFPSQLGPIPVGVIWWGALGGITISFGGIVKHRKHFDLTMTIWYVFKPFLAMISAAASYLIFTMVIKGTGSSVDSTNGTFYVLAFLVGYREETFRALIKEATDLLLKPGKSSSS